jgi:arsenate reductase
MLTVYGIRQCDTCRKALRWLSARGTECQFHDLRRDGLDKTLLEDWLDSPFASQLVNRRSTTWRQLSDVQRQHDGKDLVKLILEYPTLIKRPVFVDDQVLAVGFKPSELEGL